MSFVRQRLNVVGCVKYTAVFVMEDVVRFKVMLSISLAINHLLQLARVPLKISEELSKESVVKRIKLQLYTFETEGAVTCQSV